jgi:hypothetical protein
MLAILPVLGLFGALLWFANVSRPTTFVLADGSSVELLQVTYGTNHVVQLQPWYLRLRSRMAASFPRFFTPRRNPLTVSPLTSSNNAVVVWLRRTKPPGSTLDQLNVFALDSAKTACQEAVRTTQISQSITQEITGYLFTAFPRRDRQFVVACNVRDPARSTVKTLAEFTIPLHQGQPSNVWRAEKFPVTKRDGNLSFSLTRLQTGMDMNRRNKQATNIFNAGIRAGFRVTEGDHLLTDWQPGKIWLSDASGNVAESLSYYTYEKSGEQLILFKWGLWPKEPVWKLQTEFTRTGGFESNEVWRVSIPALLMASDSKYYSWKQSNWLAKTTLNGDVVKIASLLADSYSGLQGGNGSPRPFLLEIDALPQRGDFRITLLEVSDETGRKLERDSFSWGAGSASYRFPDLGTAKTLNLVVAYHQNRYVEFMAKPEPLVEDKSDAKPR